MPATIGLIIAILIVFAGQIYNGVAIAGVGQDDLPTLARMGAIIGGWQ